MPTYKLLGPNNIAFAISNETSLQPKWLAEAFQLEQEIRDKYWNPRIQPGDVVFDVGAAYGSYTFPAILLGAKVIAMEPDRDVYYDLCTNLNLNGLISYCVPLNVAASESKELAAIPFYPDLTSAVDYKAGDSGGNKNQSVKVFSVAIDTIVGNYSIQKVDWIKIDVEGYEVRVLMGAENTLRRFHPKVLIEYHNGFVPNVEATVRAFMNTVGYANEEKIRLSGIHAEGENNRWSLWSA